MAEEPRGAWAHLLAAHALLGASVTATVALILAVCCLAAGAPRLALACLALAVAAAALGVLAWAPRWRRRAVLGALGGALAVGLALTLPHGRPPAPALVRGVLLDGGEDEGRRWFAGLPEREAVRLGAWLELRGRERRWLEAGLFDRAYDAIAAGDAVDPATSLTLDAWFTDRRHVWLATPDGPGPHPLVVFLHGNGGPFQFYPHVLARPALERGFVLAMPTWGFGDWTGDAGRRRILETVEAVARRCPIDRRRVFLAGLSAGGWGAVDAFARDPGPFAACATISGADTDAPLGAPPFGGRPLLVIHGAEDRRFAVERPRALVERARAAGGRVEYVEVAGGDHFILLTHEREVVPRLFDWLRERHRE